MEAANEKMETESVTASDRLSRFRGCLVGSVIGDCLGFPFEDVPRVSKSTIDDFINAKLEHSPGRGSEANEILIYTDDTAMARCIADCLIDNKGLNPKDLAKRFTEEYYTPESLERGYGIHVTAVFRALKQSNYVNPFGPARQQFEGKGSYGNGAAMRVAPVALFCRDKQTMIKMAKETSLLTHTHPEGYKGAILQCLALNLALQPGPIVPEEFVNRLIEEMELVDRDKTNVGIEGESFYKDQLEKVKLALANKDLTPKSAAMLLGNTIAAYESVPTAIYAFLRGLQEIPAFQSDFPFVRTLYLCISFGGDTDTIGTMACALSGAHHGIEGIPSNLALYCDGVEYADEQARKLEKVTC